LLQNTLAHQRLFKAAHAQTQFTYLLFETVRKVRVHRRPLYRKGGGISSHKMHQMI
jgi:hypothetical protein